MKVPANPVPAARRLTRPGHEEDPPVPGAAVSAFERLIMPGPFERQIHRQPEEETSRFDPGATTQHSGGHRLPGKSCRTGITGPGSAARRSNFQETRHAAPDAFPMLPEIFPLAEIDVTATPPEGGKSPPPHRKPRHDPAPMEAAGDTVRDRGGQDIPAAQPAHAALAPPASPVEEGRASGMPASPARQILEAIKAAGIPTGSGTHTVLRLALKPAGLGEVEVRIAAIHGFHSVRIEAVHAETATLLERDRDVIAALFRAHGLDLGPSGPAVVHSPVVRQPGDAAGGTPPFPPGLEHAPQGGNAWGGHPGSPAQGRSAKLPGSKDRRPDNVPSETRPAGRHRTPGYYV